MIFSSNIHCVTMADVRKLGSQNTNLLFDVEPNPTTLTGPRKPLVLFIYCLSHFLEGMQGKYTTFFYWVICEFRKIKTHPIILRLYEAFNWSIWTVWSYNRVVQMDELVRPVHSGFGPWQTLDEMDGYKLSVYSPSVRFSEPLTTRWRH